MTAQGKGGWTPGPWFAVQHTNGWTIQDREGGCGEMLAQNYSSHDKTVGANARLIAAAPTLLEALEECILALDVSRSGGEYPDFVAWEAKARAAISLARGEPKTGEGG